MALKERLTIDNEDNHIKEFVDGCANVYLYGAGSIAMQVVSYLNTLHLDYDGFIVTDSGGEGQYLFGKKIYSIDDISLKENDGIIIAVGGHFFEEIKETVESRYPNSKIFWVNKFLDIKYNKEYISNYNVPQTGFFSQFRCLDEIGKRFSTDKCSKFHDYLRKYELFLQYYRDKSFNLLELGVYRGESLATWNGATGGYFTKAHIVGVDIDERCRKFQSNAEIIITDLGIEENVLRLRDIKPSIIIDDASHFWSHQIMALFLLWDCLPSGGIYIVEDIETSFPNAGFTGCDDAIISAYDVCTAIAEVATSGAKLRQNSVFEDEINKIGLDVDMAVFIKGSCVLIKK